MSYVGKASIPQAPFKIPGGLEEPGPMFPKHAGVAHTPNEPQVVILLSMQAYAVYRKYYPIEVHMP